MRTNVGSVVDLRSTRAESKQNRLRNMASSCCDLHIFKHSSDHRVERYLSLSEELAVKDLFN